MKRKHLKASRSYSLTKQLMRVKRLNNDVNSVLLSPEDHCGKAGTYFNVLWKTIEAFITVGKKSVTEIYKRNSCCSLLHSFYCKTLQMCNGIACEYFKIPDEVSRQNNTITRRGFDLNLLTFMTGCVLFNTLRFRQCFHPHIVPPIRLSMDWREVGRGLFLYILTVNTHP